MVIALTGFKRSGKNTCTSYLHEKYGFTEYSFAQPIKTISYVLFGWDSKQDEALKEEIDPFWHISRRQFWQWFGTEAMQFSLPEFAPLFKEGVGRKIWVKFFQKNYNKNKNYAISDMRFIHEQEELIKDMGVITIKVTNPNIKTVDVHASEQEIGLLKYDYEVFNDKDFSHLYAQLDNIMQRLNIKKV